MQMKSSAKYEKKIQEPSTGANTRWMNVISSMSLIATNEQLEKVRMELDNKLFDILSWYEHDKKFWVAAVNNLEEKIKVMKEEHSQLSHEAHECSDSIPEMNKMVFAVQSLGNIRVFCRCRPLSKAEVTAGHETVVDFDAAKDGELGILSGGSTKKTFKFDRVYTPKDDQGYLRLLLLKSKDNEERREGSSNGEATISSFYLVARWVWGEGQAKDRDEVKDDKVIKKILKEGEGYDRPNDGATVKLKLIGKLEDGTIFLKKGHDNDKELFKFKTDEALLTVAPEYAFGSSESHQELAVVPPNSYVMYSAGSTYYHNDSALPTTTLALTDNCLKGTAICQILGFNVKKFGVWLVFSPSQCLIFPAPKPFFCCVVPAFYPIFVPEDVDTFDVEAPNIAMPSLSLAQSNK
ncbi:Kinesin-like protein KIN-14R [Camellia lanceoleosa]|uniref:Kinesin-like protein KIN-14R n=1 Tax=Camellia lanceoleosa TaxID=1840588 RepID=A0ACC0IM55_9ERIC|nr:Kinesin-like protein KIN-14R [Camellia lanceoleosa]